MTRPDLDPKRGRVDELDGLRGILSMWVMVAHVFCWCDAWNQKFSHPILWFLWMQFISASEAVATFVILSGFAISFLLHGKPSTYLGFMQGRFFRIYPVYLICLAFGLLSTFVVPHISQALPWSHDHYLQVEVRHHTSERTHFLSHLFLHLTLLNGLIPQRVLVDTDTAFLPPAWSITLEWQYYLVAPLLARAFRWNTGTVLVLVTALIAYHYEVGVQSRLPAGLPGFLPFFLVGIGSYNFYAWFRTSGGDHSRIYLLAFGVLATLAALTYPTHTISLSIWALTFGCVMVRGGDICSRGFAALRRVLLHPGLQFLGKISYPIYLVHWPVLLVALDLLLRLCPAITSGVALPILLAVVVPATVTIASLLHRYVEAPAMAWGKAIGSRRRSQAGAPA